MFIDAILHVNNNRKAQLEQGWRRDHILHAECASPIPADSAHTEDVDNLGRYSSPKYPFEHVHDIHTDTGQLIR